MRVYLQSKQLGEALAKNLAQKGKTQKAAAKELSIAQGQISHLLSGDFKTKNSLVILVCKYVNIDPDEFKVTTRDADKVDQDAIVALARACRGQKRKTAVVIRVLRALETLDPAR
jgi:transcriptional regulator with XRE-family HTH domain